MSFIDVLTAFSILFGGFTVYFQTVFKNKTDTVKLIDTLVKYNWFEFYRSRLKSSLDSVDNYLGKPSFSWLSIANNLSFHYLLAIAYVFMVFFIIWFLGGGNSIGAVEILPQKESYIERFTVLVTIAFIAALFYFISSKEFETIDEKFKGKFKNLLPQSLQQHSQLIEKSLIFLISFSFFYYFNTLTYAIIFSLLITFFFDSLLYLIGVVGVGIVGGVLVVGVGIVVLVVVGGVVVGGVVVGLVVVYGIITLIDTGNFWNPLNTSFLIFFLLIPLFNSLLDFISLSLSRYFSRKILNENIFLIVFHLILDFIFAILFLFALMALLYYSVELFNTFVDEKLQIPIEQMIYATIENPFSLDNAWITFMLLSTLIPTLLHILLALVSLVLYVSKTSDWFIHQVEEGQKSEGRRIKASALLAFPVTLLSIVLFYAFIYLPVIWILPTAS